MNAVVRFATGGAAAMLLWCAAMAGPLAQQEVTVPPTALSVDFLATTADGTPIADVTADQVTLRVDNKVRVIRSLNFVSVPGRNTAAVTPEIPDPPFGTNVLSDAAQPTRALVIVVEDESLEPGREKPMRDAVTALVRTLSPRDRIALFVAPRGGLRSDFTTNHDRVLQMLNQVAGLRRRGDDPACRTRDTLYALTALLQNLEGSQHPVTVLFFSTSMMGPSGMTRTTTAEDAPLMGTCLLRPETFQEVGTAAERARANFYVVPSDTLVTGAPLEGIENLAGVTAGRRLGLVGGAETALSRITRETSGYYVATFVPEPAERDGIMHRLDVKVARRDVTVRGRAALYLPKPPDLVAVKGTARDLLRESRMHRDLPLYVVAFASRKPNGQLGIVALAEPAEPGVTFTSAAVGIYDQKNQLVAQWTARDEDLAARPVQAGLPTAPGQYRVRAAAVDVFGRRGTADYTLDATLTTAGTLQLSSLVLGLSRDGRFLPRMMFGSEASAVAMVEIYGGVAGAPIGALIEISESASGPALATARLVLEPTGEPDRFIARGTIPIGALLPGDYVVRAIVEAEGQPAGRVLRPFRKISATK